MTGKDMASQLGALNLDLKDQNPEKSPDPERQLNTVAWEFGWRRRLNLMFDDGKLLEKVKKIASTARNENATSTQVNHLAQMAVNASTWSEILNYLNKQMSKTDHKARRNAVWMKPLREFLEQMELKAHEITDIAWRSANRSLDDRHEINLLNQEAALILFRGMLERFAGFSLYLQAAEKDSRHG